MYVVYVNNKLYGVTSSRAKAYKVLKNVVFGIEYNDEARETLFNSYLDSEYYNNSLTDGGDNWAEYTETF